jgi:hypothetical protein
MVLDPMPVLPMRLNRSRFRSRPRGPSPSLDGPSLDGPIRLAIRRLGPIRRLAIRRLDPIRHLGPIHRAPLPCRELRRCRLSRAPTTQTRSFGTSYSGSSERPVALSGISPLDLGRFCGIAGKDCGNHASLHHAPNGGAL